MPSLESLILQRQCLLDGWYKKCMTESTAYFSTSERISRSAMTKSRDDLPPMTKPRPASRSSGFLLFGSSSSKGLDGPPFCLDRVASSTPRYYYSKKVVNDSDDLKAVEIDGEVIEATDESAASRGLRIMVDKQLNILIVGTF
jgi:hypothetical protein